MADKLLSISLLVSGRADTTEKCLLSLKKLREELGAEIILVDTGCPESWRKPLEDYADKVVGFTWCNDFAKARNAGLEAATGAWFLFLDDDEWFEDVTPIIDFFKSGEYQEYHQAVYKARNYSDADGSSYTDEWVSRMIRLEPDTHFEGSVHEALVPTRGKCKKIDAFVHHYGYAFANEEQRNAHRRRNVAILEQLLAQEPNNMRWYLQILQEYADKSVAAELRTYAQQAIQLVEDVDQPFANQCRGAFYTAALLADLWLDETDRLFVDCETFTQDRRNTYETNCSLYYYWTKGIMEKQKDKELPLDEEKKLQDKMAECAEGFVSNYELHKEQTTDEQAQIIEESIPFVKDVMQDGIYDAEKLQWAVSLAQSGRKNEVPADYVEELTLRLQRKMENNGEFLLMQDEYWELGKARLLPLEQMILELPLSQWMAQVFVLETYRSEDLWDKIRTQLIELQTVENIRYDYFHAKAVNAVITECAAGKTYEELQQYLWEYATCNVKLAQWIYTDEAYTGEMEMIEEPCRAAILMQRALECDAKDWSGVLDNLKKAATAWPALGETVKQYAQLVGQEQEKLEKQQAENELDKMAAEVKQQVIALTENGMYAQALEIVKQLRQMMPEDEDFIYLEKELEQQLA